jgi:hypothetical protein
MLHVLISAMKGNLVLSEDMLKENLTTAEKKIEHLTEVTFTSEWFLFL